MLNHDENELLCRTGPGTPMGDLMRQYWLPALRSEELPAPDSSPLRLRLLGEDLIAFRVTSGRAGIVVNACPHRGASLFFGRNEEEGLRCVYHGWKFDVTGACVDMPSEPAESNFKSKVRVRAYPCEERNGVIWTYMGPREVPPPLPELEANLVPNANFRNRVIECNYMQALEGDIDTIHAGFLHYGHVDVAEITPNSCYYHTLRHKSATFVTADNEVGTSYGAYRPANDGTDYWRVAHYLFPFYTMNPSDLLGQRIAAFAWVPIDDNYCMSWAITVQPANRDVNATGIGGLVRGLQTLRGPRGEAPVVAGLQEPGTGFNSRFRPVANLGNDFMVDREAQRTNVTFSGIPSDAQDPAVQESMGAIYDRSQEHLATTDSMIIRTRRRMIAAAKALREDGAVPPGVDNPALYRLRSGGAILPNGVDGLGVLQDVIWGRAQTLEAPVAAG
jgi:phenylpropionate dioxygenase-like ring-hydroxylating dioxygenase large terminal subunit